MANEEPNKINIRVAMMRYLLKNFGVIAGGVVKMGFAIIWRCLRYSEKEFIAESFRAMVDSAVGDRHACPLPIF